MTPDQRGRYIQWRLAYNSPEQAAQAAFEHLERLFGEQLSTLHERRTRDNFYSRLTELHGLRAVQELGEKEVERLRAWYYFGIQDAKA